MTNDYILTPKMIESLDKLTPDEKIALKAKLMHFDRVPVSIDEFIESEQYLGVTTKEGRTIYPFWREFLREIYPDPLTSKSPIVILTGGIGIGKSYVSTIMALYTLYKVLCIRDFEYFDLNLIKGVNLVFFHVNVEKAINDFVIPFNSEYIANSIFFQRNKNNQKYVLIPEGPRANKGIGGDVVYYNLSEINFIPHHKAVDKINSAISRFFSRFRGACSHFGHVVLDSSAFGDASVVDQVIADSPHDIKVVRAPIWKVKAHTNQFSKTYFRVYTGDAIQKPFIIEEGTSIPNDIDVDKIIEVPDNLLPEYKSDIYKALQETAGVSTSMSGRYISDISRLNESFVIEQDFPDVMVVDFFDPNDKILDKIRDSINKLIPKDKIIAIRFDVAITGDLCGISIAYLEDMVCINERIQLYEPSITVPIAFALSRKEGQETPITKLKEFVVDLSQDYEIGCITMDQFQSRQLIQDLQREGFDSYLLSVDRDNRSYDVMKNMIYEGRLKQPINKLLMIEETQLRIINGKIDHLPMYSKDISDTVAGNCRAILDHLETFSQVSSVYALQSSRRVLDRSQNKPESVKKLENRIINLY